MNELALGLALVSLVIWLGLLLVWGQFWRVDQQLNEKNEHSISTQGKEVPDRANLPTVCVVIPARNEAAVLPMTLRSILTQTYAGAVHTILVDDHSTDETAHIARSMAQTLEQSSRLTVLLGQPLPSGWTGKLWAVAQGVQQAETIVPLPDYFLLTDADIQHDRDNLDRLVAKAQQANLDLVSLMVRLRCESFWEKCLIPAFIFFFQKLYPFRWVNHPTRRTAAAAGGCVLIRREVLSRIGGIAAIHQALIDDCALAQAVKSSNLTIHGEGRIWLGLSDRTRSLRAYPTLSSIWEMVARTAFTQLEYSLGLLLGTLMGMSLIYVVPVLSAMVGLLLHDWGLMLAGLAGWGAMTIAYYPTVRFYQISPLFALGLPAIALLYTLMTLDSAIRHWQGRGGAWKGRTYQI
ncbi:MAG: glycosyltransferase [Scytolyngbya sp. HA4215-MV1]|jgi:hopene-associated glycosyltransferase HpnB|nr:glycosyltransferase [Scytolyngbya sp. HA4215-MV1]